MQTLYFYLPVGFNVLVLDYQERVYLILILEWQIQVYSYFRTVCVIDQSIIAHSGHKRNTVPLAKNSIANKISGLVAHSVEVISLTAHVRLIVPDSVHNLRLQPQKKFQPRGNRLLQAHAVLAG